MITATVPDFPDFSNTAYLKNKTNIYKYINYSPFISNNVLISINSTHYIYRQNECWRQPKMFARHISSRSLENRSKHGTWNISKANVCDYGQLYELVCNKDFPNSHLFKIQNDGWLKKSLHNELPWPVGFYFSSLQNELSIDCCLTK